MTRHCLAALAIATLIAPATASAQVDPMEWHRGTALSVFAGAATASGGSDGALGGAIGWELTPRLTLEGTGLWTMGNHVDAFTGLAGGRANLLPRRVVTPFLSAALGVHRTSLATPVRERSRDSFVSAVGGGVDVYVRRHLALRPDVRVLFVNQDAGGRRAVAVYGMHLVYHFEERPITP